MAQPNATAALQCVWPLIVLGSFFKESINATHPPFFWRPTRRGCLRIEVLLLCWVARRVSRCVVFGFHACRPTDKSCVYTLHRGPLSKKQRCGFENGLISKKTGWVRNLIVRIVCTRCKRFTCKKQGCGFESGLISTNMRVGRETLIVRRRVQMHVTVNNRQLGPNGKRLR